MRFMFFAVRVWRNPPLKERCESTTDLKTSILTFKGIWFLTRYKDPRYLFWLLLSEYFWSLYCWMRDYILRLFEFVPVFYPVCSFDSFFTKGFIYFLIGVNKFFNSFLYVSRFCVYSGSLPAILIKFNQFWAECFMMECGYCVRRNYGQTIGVQKLAEARDCQQVLWLYGPNHSVTLMLVHEVNDSVKECLALLSDYGGRSNEYLRSLDQQPGRSVCFLFVRARAYIRAYVDSFYLIAAIASYYLPSLVKKILVFES